jgi:hypothetical protein
LERERPQIVSNFAPSASAGYESSSHLAGRVALEKKAAHHFLVGYFQMSLRDEVFSERYLALS